MKRKQPFSPLPQGCIPAPNSQTIGWSQHSRQAIAQLDGVRPHLFSWSLVCACNMNRSPSGHAALTSRGYKRVSSFGTSDLVRVPGRFGPCEFSFGTDYRTILRNMINNDRISSEWMQTYGLTSMLQRNTALKAAPESWQQQNDDRVRQHDFVVCFDRAVYDAVLDDLFERKEAAVPWTSPQRRQHLPPSADASGASCSLLLPAITQNSVTGAAGGPLDAGAAIDSDLDDPAAPPPSGNVGAGAGIAAPSLAGVIAAAGVAAARVQQVVLPSRGTLVQHAAAAVTVAAGAAAVSPRRLALGSLGSLGHAATPSLVFAAPPSQVGVVVASSSAESSPVTSTERSGNAPDQLRQYRKQVFVVLLHTQDNINDAAVAATNAAKFADDVTAEFLRDLQRHRDDAHATSGAALDSDETPAAATVSADAALAVVTAPGLNLFVTPPAIKRRRIEPLKVEPLQVPVGSALVDGGADALVETSGVGAAMNDQLAAVGNVCADIVLDICAMKCEGGVQLQPLASSACADSGNGQADSGIGLACDLSLPAATPVASLPLPAGSTTAHMQRTASAPYSARSDGASEASIAVLDALNVSSRTVPTAVSPLGAASLALQAAPQLAPLRSTVDVLEAMQHMDAHLVRRLVLEAVKSAVKVATAHWGDNVEWNLVTV